MYKAKENEPNMIDKNKKYKTRDGKEVRIYATDSEGKFSVHGAVKEVGEVNKWTPFSWTNTGRFSGDSQTDAYDLVPATTKLLVEVEDNITDPHSYIVLAYAEMFPHGNLERVNIKVLSTTKVEY